MTGPVPTRVADVATEIIDDEVLLYDPRQTRAVHLNATAALVWGLCDGLRSVDEITRLIEECYPDASAALRQEVQVALKELLENGVLVVRSDAT
jgi:hypothetical protein